MKEIAPGSFLTNHEDANEEYAITEHDLDRYKQDGLKLVEVIFQFENIDYPGYEDHYKDDADQYTNGMLLMADGVGYNERNKRSGSVPSSYIFPGSRIFYGSDGNPVQKGQKSGSKRWVLLVNEDVSKVKLRFTTLKDDWNHRYEKHFYCDIS